MIDDWSRLLVDNCVDREQQLRLITLLRWRCFFYLILKLLVTVVSIEIKDKGVTMNQIVKLAKCFSKNARAKRAAIFRNAFEFDADTKILDLGSETGANINSVLQGTLVKPDNIYIADISSALIEKGKDTYGYIPVLIDESGKLPFEDQFFDIVFCSSVIEHVTVPKEMVWSLKSGAAFKEKSLLRQKEFANEIKRLGKQYFVQTPYKHFPIESHSWMPFVAWLPRGVLITLLKFTNKFWIKQTSPDWYLLNEYEMSDLFKGAEIVNEKVFCFTKSIMAIKSSKEKVNGYSETTYQGVKSLMTGVS